MAALLTSEMDSSDGVVKYISECRNHGIAVLTPEINTSGKDFVVIGERIRFGLLAIKNVGESAIDAILEERGRGAFTSLFDFCGRVDLRKVNKRVLESLVKCGTFEGLGGHRAQLFAAIEDALDYGQRLQRERLDPQLGLFDLGGGAGGAEAPPPPALLDVPAWDEKTLLGYEKESLGFFISGHPLQRFEGLMDQFTTANTLSLRETSGGEAVRVGGLVRSVKVIQTKKGDLMAFVLLEDLHGSVEVVVFSELYAKGRDFLVEDAALLFQGQVQRDEKATKILADTLIPMEQAEETWTASIHLTLDLERTDAGQLSGLREIMARYPGPCPAHLHLQQTGQAEAVIAVSERYRLRADAALRREVQGLLGYPALHAVCSEITLQGAAGGNGTARRGKAAV